MSSDPNPPAPETNPVEAPAIESALTGETVAYPRGEPGHVPIADRAALDPEIRNGASWFFWIAGLTIINSILHASGSEFGLATGLVVNSFVDVVAVENKAPVFSVVFGAVSALILAGLGVAAGKGARWAFVLGIIGLVIDVLPAFLAPGEMILTIGIHFWAVYCFFRGYASAKHLTAT